MKRVFISYSRRNKTFAERLARDLDDAGLEVWIDWRQISGGERWRDEIYRGIERSEFMVVCVSPDAVQSQWVRREILTARADDKTIIPVIAVNAKAEIEASEEIGWLDDLQYIDFVERYEQAFPELLDALPGARPIGTYDLFDPENLPNPFKGLEAFQQTDAHFFFGREGLIRKSLNRLKDTRFLAIVGASGSGKSSLVRAGILPKLREGALSGSDQWAMILFTPGAAPLEALATRLLPMLPQTGQEDVLQRMTSALSSPETILRLSDAALSNTSEGDSLLMVIDQFEEVFTRASESEREPFLNVLQMAITHESSRVRIIITMRADFFGQLSRYPELAELFEDKNLVIATEMKTANLLRTIEGPAKAVGLSYDDGLVDRILEDVSRQPGSLPLLQYALQQLFEQRDGTRLTTAAYEEIGGVRKALAQHAETIYQSMSIPQQDIVRRVLLRLVEVGDTGEATRRRVDRNELHFRGVDDAAVAEVIDLLTSAESRLLITSREIRTSTDEEHAPIIWLEVSHEALIREWERFKTWVSSTLEDLQYNSQLLKAAHDWQESDYDSAFLLIGKRLTRAEVWLEKADANQLQRDYIAASITGRERQEQLEQEQQQRELALERRARNRLRNFVVVLVISLIAAIGLSLLAFNSSQEAARNALLAEQSANAAERSAEEAQSLALASGAGQSFSDNEQELAVALALQANTIDNPPPQAQRTLADVAYAPGTRQRFDTRTNQISVIAISPDGRLFATGETDGEVILWDATTGQEVRRFTGEQMHQNSITDLAFSPNGQQLVSSSEDSTRTSDVPINLILWDVDSGNMVYSWQGSSIGIQSVGFVSDGAYLIADDGASQLKTWDTTTGSAFSNIEPDTDISVMNARSDGLTAIVGTEDGDVMEVSISNGATLWNSPVSPEAVRGEGVTSLAYSTDFERVIASYEHNIVVIWKAGVEEVRLGPFDVAIINAELSSDQETIAIAFEDGTLSYYNLLSRRETQKMSFNREIVAMERHRAAQQVIVAFADGTVRFIDTQSSEEIRRFEGHTQDIYTVDVSSDGRLGISGARNGEIILWDLETGAAIRPLSNLSDRINSVAFSPDGTRAASATVKGALSLWDVETGAELRHIENEVQINSVVFSHNGQQILSGLSDNRVILWDAESGSILREMIEHGKSVNRVAFSPDDTLAASAASDGTIILWDVVTGEMVRTFTGHEETVNTVGFSPDGTLLLSGSADDTLRLWRVSDGQILTVFTGHDNVVRDIAFLPDASAIVSAATDGTIRLWDINTGFELRRYTVINERLRPVAIRSIALHPDGNSLLSGLAQPAVRLWRVIPDVDGLIEWTRNNRFVRDFTCTELRLFNIDPTCDVSS